MAEEGASSVGGTAGAGVGAPVRQVRINPLSYVLTHQRICGYIFIAPWFIGFLIWTLGPFLASIYLSLTNWSIIGAAKFLGLGNYQKMFTTDARYRAALINTIVYVVTSIPLKQIIALTIALLLDQKLRGIYIYRTIFYLPAVTSGVATSILWSMVFGYRMGILNAVLAKIGITPQPWLTDIDLALPTLIFISLWNVGGIFIIYLAGDGGDRPGEREKAKVLEDHRSVDHAQHILQRRHGLHRLLQGVHSSLHHDGRRARGSDPVLRTLSILQGLPGL